MRPRLILGPILALSADVAWAANFCAVETGEVDFGIYDPTSREPNDSVGNIGLRCNCAGDGCDAIQYSIAITDADGSGANRSMDRDGPVTSRLRFDLYIDPNRTNLWGSGDRALSGVFEPSRFGETIPIPVYGRIRPLQSVGPGHYSIVSQVVVVF
jgi:spore coat protein U-like protein